MRSRRLFTGFLTLLSLMVHLTLFSQEDHVMETFRELEMASFAEAFSRSLDHETDSTIDVTFYHLDLTVAVDSVFLSGSNTVFLEPVIDGTDHFFLDLHHSLTVDSITFPCTAFSQSGDRLAITLDKAYAAGEPVQFTIHYGGKPVKAGGIKGLVYEDHNNGEPVIATLSTPYLAHYWYPCKDGPDDKVDSVHIDITIKDTLINGIELTAVSNGVLKSVESTEGHKTFRWRHSFPIVSYYVMVAISNYARITDQFETDSGFPMPLEYYVFNESYDQSMEGVAGIPEVIGKFSELFGEYPFFREKFGMTQLGFYGAIENQTNVIQNVLHEAWFLVSVHELAHMWFGDMITCSDWHHGWLNEGFASYCEALWVENEEGNGGYHNYLGNLKYTGGGTLYLENTDDPFNIFVPIIYQKGAWLLHMLRGVLGDDLFFSALRSYALTNDYRYAHARTSDFQYVVESVSGLDLDSFFDQWVYDSYYPIYRYNFGQEGDTAYFVLQQSQQENGWRDIFEMPVRLKFWFDDNTDTTFTVNNDQVLQFYRFAVGKKIAWAEPDPDEWILRQTFYEEELPVTGLAESVAEMYRVYPNPAKDFLIFESKGTGASISCFELFDATGKKILKVPVSGVKTTIDVRNMDGGVYFYRICSWENLIPVTGKVLINM